MKDFSPPSGARGSVLVTDSHRSSAIAVIRSLGRAGFRVIAADSMRESAGFRSCHAADRLVYPDPTKAPNGFVATLLATARTTGVELILPLTDETIHPLSRARALFEGVSRLGIASEAALEVVTDKQKTLELARRLGVPVPRTLVVRTVEEARHAASELSYPVVLKPAVSRVYLPDRQLIEKCSVSYARDRSELIERMRPHDGRHVVLLQEYCTGVGCGVELLACEGRPLALFQHRRLAEIPLSGGASAWRESVPLDPVLKDHALRLVEALRWTGLLMVEFKVGKSPTLMEINGRVWGSIPLAIQSGVDFPRLWAEQLKGHGAASPIDLISDYRIGVRRYNLELLLMWIVNVLFKRSRYPFLGKPPRSGAFAAILALLDPSQRSDNFSAADPMPFLADLYRILARAPARMFKSGRSA